MSSRATSAFRLAPRGASTSMGSLIVSWGTCPGVRECVPERDGGGGAGAKTGSLSLHGSFARFCQFFSFSFFCPALTCGRSLLLLCGSAQLVWDSWKRRRSGLHGQIVAALLSLIDGSSQPKAAGWPPGHFGLCCVGPPSPVQPRYVLAVLAVGSCLACRGRPDPSNKGPRSVSCNPSPSSTRLDFGLTGHSQQHH